MDITPPWGWDSDDPGPSIRRIYQRLTAVYDGHTHIYMFPQEESENALEMIRLHVTERQLHPKVGAILADMIVGD